MSKNAQSRLLISKSNFLQKSVDHDFFRIGRASFVRIFDHVEIYKHKILFKLFYLLENSSPKIDSNPNVNE